MHKTNALKKTLYFMLLLLTAFATLFAFTACNPNNIEDTGDNGQTGDTGDTGDEQDTKPTYTIAIETNLSDIATLSGDGTYNEGDTVTIVLTDLASGYYLDHWNTGERTDTISFVADSNKTVTAYFEKGESQVVNGHKVAIKNGTIDVSTNIFTLKGEKSTCSYITSNNQIIAYGVSKNINCSTITRDTFYEVVNTNVGVIALAYVDNQIGTPDWLENDTTAYSTFTTNLSSTYYYAIMKLNDAFSPAINLNLDTEVNNLDYVRGVANGGYMDEYSKTISTSKTYITFYEYNICYDLQGNLIVVNRLTTHHAFVVNQGWSLNYTVLFVVSEDLDNVTSYVKNYEFGFVIKVNS